MSKDNNTLAYEITDLRREFSRRERTMTVLDGIDLKVQAGAFVAVQGASGCGKTTLLQLLGALDAPSGGTIRCLGRELASLGPFKRARFRRETVGFVFQSYQLLPELTALENVMIAGRLGRRPGRELAARSRDLLERVGMSDRATHRPAELSGGEQQRIALARAFMNEPQIILADEPTGNLDARNAESIMALLHRAKDEHDHTIVMVTHDRKLAAETDIVYTMEKGRVHR